MELPLPARYIAGIIGIIVFAGLAYSGDLQAQTAVVAIIGILVSLGAYERPSPRQRE